MSIVHVPTFEINLDLPAEERYLEIYVNFSENIKPLFTSFYKSIPRSRKKFFPAFAKFLEKSDNEYYKEMEALAKIIEMEPYECIAVEHCCEFMVGCTSVLAKAKDEVNGGYKIIHGRNLDYPLEVSLMRDVLYKGVMTKDGKEIGTSLIFAGFQLYTSIKKGAYSISYNQRMKKQENGFLKSMVLAFLGYKKYSRIIQETLITCDTFDEAVEHLKSTPSLNDAISRFEELTEESKSPETGSKPVSSGSMPTAEKMAIPSMSKLIVTLGKKSLRGITTGEKLQLNLSKPLEWNI
eukprot:CAMPEP_0196996418 /NCGR_PEP_ID=MMETSP1380-20130617/2292_1 /TAXON_ID=5936 /ORGANISM="Euplotes crassus, Strain CT5" /LENGTH=293 /DNA_ID=CAMNT_0042412363 /DNA_START=44 /DNA_END=926 /DNA_ORIENTATION=-